MKVLLFIICISFAVFASDVEQESLLSLEVSSNNNGELHASINEVTKQGVDSGFSNISLVGTQEIKKKSILGIGQNQIKIFWEKINLDGKEVELAEPFYSEIEVDGSLEIGDVFSAKGKPAHLMHAYAQLRNNSNKDSESVGATLEEDEDLTNYIASRSSDTDANSTPNNKISDNLAGEDEVDFGPNFQVEEDAAEEETTDGCSVRYSLEDMSAYVQTKIMKGAEEVSGCRDSETSYKMIKDYKSCSAIVSISEERTYDQYSLYYTDPDLGKIIVSDCAIDIDKFTMLTRDYDSCSISHNFSEGISTPLYRLVNNKGTIYKDCGVDDDIKYIHNKTRSGCSKNISKDAVIYSERVSIQVDGTEIYISECEPSDSNIKIYEEVCAENKYSHNNLANQSLLNKTYFYFDNGSRINIEECVKSATSFNHKFDTALCAVEHNNDNKQTTIFAKRYIEDTLQGGTLYIGDCEEVNEKVSYIKTNEIWQKSKNITISFDSLSEEYGYFVQNLPSTPKEKHEYIKRRYKEEVFHPTGKRSIRLAQFGCSVTTSDLKANFLDESDNAIFNPNKFTLKSNQANFRQDSNEISNVYHVNTALDSKFLCRSMLIDKYAGGDDTAQDLHVYKRLVFYNNITCEGSLLQKRPIYRRYDGSEYIANDETLDTALVCGDGSKLNGKRI